MSRLEIKHTKGNSAPHKKAAKAETTVVAGKSSGLSSKAKKEKLTKQNEAKKELDRLFALSATGEDSGSGSEEGSGGGLSLG